MIWLVTLVSLAVCCLIQSPRPLRYYFLAQFNAAVLYWLILSVLGLSEYHPAYVVTYVFTVGAIDFTMLWIMWWIAHPLPDWGPRILLGMGMGAFLGVFSGWGRHLGLYDWIALADGALCVTAAIPLGIISARRYTRLSLSLFVLWMLQGLWGLGFSLNWHDPWWMRVNEFVPTFLCVAGSLWIALFCVPTHPVPLHQPQSLR